MEAAFWHQRWEENRIGFHQADFNRWLQSWWSAQQQGEPVLVPLCGKSRDMLWLSGQGHPVDGFELSSVAINSFFSENKLSETVSAEGPYQCHQHESLRIYEGDFFAAPELGRRYRLAYDRAALIALPTAMRRQYAELMSRLIEAGGQILLVTLEYQPEQQRQPPFSWGRWRCAPCSSATSRWRCWGERRSSITPGCCRASSPTSTRWPTGWCAVHRPDQKRELRP